MNYPLHNLVDDKEFEKIIASICEEILGTGTIIFSEGKDGGRDAKFNGRANKFPSESNPWEGKIVIQVKHTIKPFASCSDPDFQCILKKEIKNSLISLKKNKKIDYYLLFTNRRLSGLQDAKIEDFLDSDVKIDNYIIGDEKIQLWLRQNTKIVKTHNLDKLLLPLQFYEEDLKEIIIAFSETKAQPVKIKQIEDLISRIDIEEKNKLNKLSKEYFNNVLKKSYSEFSRIENFLEDPKNILYKNYYDNTIADLQEKIIIHRSEYIAFEEIFNYLYEYVFQNNQEKLKDKRNLIRIFLHYMYHNCDIGIEE
jgi:hypothetical protein